MTRQHQIPRFNRKVYQTPRERFTSQTNSLPAVHGRRALYQDSYARRTKHGSLRFMKPLLVGIGLILLVQSFFQIPFFRIEAVDVQGLKYIQASEVQSFINSELGRRRWIIFKNNNYFLVAQEKMKRRLEDRFYLDVLELVKKFPDRLSIVVHERISAFVVQTPEGYFTLGIDGAALRDVEKPGDQQLLIADERAERLRSVPLPYLEQATALAEDWQQTVTSVKLRAFHLNDDPERMTVSTATGFKVFFDPEKEFHPQLARLSVFLLDRDFTAPGEYIDMRFDETVYTH